MKPFMVKVYMPLSFVEDPGYFVRERLLRFFIGRLGGGF